MGWRHRCGFDRAWGVRMNDRRRFSLKAFFLAYLAGVAVFCFAVMLCVGAIYAALDALYREGENRAAAQIANDKRLLLTVPALYEAHSGRVDSCRIVKNEVECSGHDKSGRINLTRSN